MEVAALLLLPIGNKAVITSQQAEGILYKTKLGGKPQMKRKDAQSKIFQVPMAGLTFVTRVVCGMHATRGNAITNNTTSNIN